MKIFPRSLLRAKSHRPAFSFLLPRFHSSIDDNASGFRIFDRDLKCKQRDRAAWLMRPKDVLVDTVAANLLDRLEDCKKTFPTALCLGGSLWAVRRLIRGHGGIEELIMMDMSKDMIQLCKNSEQDGDVETVYVVGDEENLPMQESSLDLVISCLGLHWTNDLPGAMIQVCSIYAFMSYDLTPSKESLKNFSVSKLHGMQLATQLEGIQEVVMIKEEEWKPPFVQSIFSSEYKALFAALAV